MATSPLTPSLSFFLFFFTYFFLSAAADHLFLSLTHSLSTAAPTPIHHLLKSTTARSAARNRRRSQVSLPLSPGTDYTLTFSLNSQTLSLYMDTGSDVVWFPCHPFECILCEGKSPTTFPPLNVSSGTRVSCKSRACSVAHSSASSSDLCAMAKCPLDEIETSDCQNFHCPPFYYAYGDGSLIANLREDTIFMPSNSKKPLILHNFTFGCAHSTLGEPVGVAGFGRGLLSLPAQLATLSPQLGNQFSYCLVSHSFDSTKIRQQSPLILGKYEEKQRKSGETSESFAEYVYTPMLDNPKHPYFYSIGLMGVSVGARRIPAPVPLGRVDRHGNGGVVVDSGTTFTMVPTGLFNDIVSELDRQMGRFYKRSSETEEQTGLSPCYYMGSGSGSSLIVPNFVLHFEGNSSVVLPRRNYFYQFLNGGDEKKKGKKVGCLMMMDGGDEADSGPAMTLGNYQQQGFEVVYDLEKRRVGFARRRCDSLWDELQQR